MNDALYAYSLVPVVSVATLLFSTMLFRGARPHGLTAYCGSVAIWSGFLLLAFVDGAGEFASRSSAFGAFVAASFVHTAFDFTNARSYLLVWGAYAVAAALFVLGVAIPGFLFDPTTLAAGPFFWPGMTMAVAAATIPLFQIFRAHRGAETPQVQRLLRALAGAGALGYAGAWSNALMLSQGIVLPWGMLAVLASLLLLAVVVRSTQGRAESRLMERSLAYAAVTAFVSAGFLFGVLALVEEPASAILAQYRAGAFFVLVMAALAVEPFRQHLLEAVGRRVVPHATSAAELARELAHQEERSHQAERLAELGVFTSAIAHEVRNPLGVMRANLRLLERQGAEPSVVETMEEQIERASTFLDDLLAYGRPRALELRTVNLRDTVALAFSTARQAVDASARELRNDVDDDVLVEVDQAQISQVLVVIFENAILATGPADSIRATGGRSSGDRVTLAIEDDGPGVPSELEANLFDPFVTGRKRSETRRGTGLGLAIARGIVERHGGTIGHERAHSGGARFTIELPRVQPVLGAAADHRGEEHG